MELPTVLLVTWLVHGQPPNSYQTTFTSKATCEAAKDKVLAAGIEFQMKSIETARKLGIEPTTFMLAHPPPMVTAVCAIQ